MRREHKYNLLISIIIIPHVVNLVFDIDALIIKMTK